MKLEALRTVIREIAQRRQSAWMASYDTALATITTEQRAKGKLHTAATAEAYAKCAQTVLRDVGSELAGNIVERIEAEGKGNLNERDVIAEFSATMKFGRDRLASKLLKSIEGLGLASGEGTNGLAEFKITQSYEPGESKLKTYFSGSAVSRGGKPLSEWKQSAPARERAPATPTRIWLVALMIGVGVVLGTSIWLFAELY